jgi:hypothetical protein
MKLQFSVRTLLEVIVVAAFICALIYLRRPAPSDSGRYQLLQVNQGNSSYMLMLDTQTGKSYVHSTTGQSFDPANPPK